MNVMRAPSAANIEATPNPVPYGEGAGATTISWSTGDGSPGRVYVSVDGKPEQLFAGGPDGSQDAAWIGTGTTYEFRLYSGTERTTPVAVVNVTQTDPHGISSQTHFSITRIKSSAWMMSRVWWPESCEVMLIPSYMSSTFVFGKSTGFTSHRSIANTSHCAKKVLAQQ